MMDNGFKTKHVMNTILQRAFKEARIDMSPMKAQKMLFYVHGWHLATTGSPAVDLLFEVWPYGPVIGTIYHELKKFGGGRVTEYLPDEDSGKPFIINEKCKELYESIDIAWEKYIGISAVTLSTMTHENGSPWQLSKSQGSTYISNDIVKEYFVNQARQS